MQLAERWLKNLARITDELLNFGLTRHQAVSAVSWYDSWSNSSETGDRDLVRSPVSECKCFLRWQAFPGRAVHTFLHTGLKLELWIALCWDLGGVYCLNDFFLNIIWAFYKCPRHLLMLVCVYLFSQVKIMSLDITVALIFCKLYWLEPSSVAAGVYAQRYNFYIILNI